jgi:hypothetical protein
MALAAAGEKVMQATRIAALIKVDTGRGLTSGLLRIFFIGSIRGSELRK